MKNLAGDKNCDLQIKQELEMADVPIVEAKAQGEVPYTIIGKIGQWTFKRAWYYWVVTASGPYYGLPLNVAQALHTRPYPNEEKETYGQVVRVAGHCGCPPPDEWATYYDSDGHELIEDPDGSAERRYNEIVERHPGLPLRQSLRFVPDRKAIMSFVTVLSYHVDTQVGLNEFARVAKDLEPPS